MREIKEVLLNKDLEKNKERVNSPTTVYFKNINLKMDRRAEWVD